MVDKLLDIGFEQSQIEECVFCNGNIIFIVYMDDGMFIGNNNDQLTEVIQQIKDTGLEVEDQGHPADYVGVNIKRLKDWSYELTQRALIDSIIKEVNIEDS